MVCREMNRKKSLKQILLLLCCYIAHSLHMWLAPVVRQYTVLLIGCPRFPKAACFQKFCGRSLARVCGSLIFSGFWNSVVLFAWPVGGWSIVGFAWHVSYFGNLQNWPSFQEKLVSRGARAGLAGLRVSRDFTVEGSRSGAIGVVKKAL